MKIFPPSHSFPSITFPQDRNLEVCAALSPSSMGSSRTHLRGAWSTGQPLGAEQGPRAGQMPPVSTGRRAETQPEQQHPSPLNISEKERKVVAARRKKPLISDEGLAQLSHCISLPRGRRLWPCLPTPQPQLLISHPAPVPALPRWLGQVCFPPQGLRRRRKRCRLAVEE